MCVCTLALYVHICTLQSAPVFAAVVFITKIQISWQFLTHIELYAKELINKGCYGVHKLL